LGNVTAFGNELGQQDLTNSARFGIFWRMGANLFAIMSAFHQFVA
jgi:hypothetical protein